MSERAVELTAPRSIDTESMRSDEHEIVPILFFDSDADNDFAAVVAQGHVDKGVFSRSVLASITQPLDEDFKDSVRFEYALFNDNESVDFNQSPSTPGAAPITIAYYEGPIGTVIKRGEIPDGDKTISN